MTEAVFEQTAAEEAPPEPVLVKLEEAQVSGPVAPAAEPTEEQPKAPQPNSGTKTQSQGDLLDEVADMNIPKTINMSYENEDRANQVVSPGESTFDGTSTIGSSTSEPTTETASRNSRNRSSRKAPSNRNGGSSGSRNGSRGGSSRSSNRGANHGNNQASNSNSGRRTYHRNTYSGTSRMQSSTVPRPFKRPGPLSYSKTVRLGGSSAPFSAREVDDKTRAVLADMNEYDSAQLETE